MGMNVKALLTDVLREIKPKDKHIEREAATMLRRINEQLKKDKLKAKAMSGGSIAKNTYLVYDHDCDIFVQFDQKYCDEDIAALLGSSLRKIFPSLITLHGSRDYYQLRNKLNFEIVPVLAIKKAQDAINITDCSPLHVAWVKKFPKLADEIRLTRAFCKANGVYGAESYIQGFSGHVIDVITIYYGGFLHLLKAAQKWKEKTVVDYYNIHKGKALRYLNKSKLVSPLVVIDPIEPLRNAAASVSQEKFYLFIQKAKEFLKHPSKEHFIKREFSLDLLEQKAKGKKLILLKAMPTEGKEDVVGAKLLKAFTFIRDEAKQYGFTLHEAGWYWDKEHEAVYDYILDKVPLAPSFVRQGPPVSMTTYVENFRKMHKETFVEKGRICATIKRDHVLPENFIKSLLVHPYLKDKAKKIVITTI
ncbi:nucleotidyltransferase domain-containing protein [Candidatus Woesearchaeota archaeon]|nr:nucleotidyltransferase domain-containing protein [Candidatus Woesearchaeota archaeon]